MADRVTLIGGPYDGAQVKQVVGTYVWIGGAGSSPRTFSEPSGSRQLYRLDARRDGQFVYASWTHTVCGGCGQVVKRDASRCVYCATDLLPNG